MSRHTIPTPREKMLYVTSDRFDDLYYDHGTYNIITHFMTTSIVVTECVTQL